MVLLKNSPNLEKVMCPDLSPPQKSLYLMAHLSFAGIYVLPLVMPFLVGGPDLRVMGPSPGAAASGVAAASGPGASKARAKGWKTIYPEQDCRG